MEGLTTSNHPPNIPLDFCGCEMIIDESVGCKVSYQFSIKNMQCQPDEHTVSTYVVRIVDDPILSLEFVCLKVQPPVSKTRQGNACRISAFDIHTIHTEVSTLGSVMGLMAPGRTRSCSTIWTLCPAARKDKFSCIPGR